MSTAAKILLGGAVATVAVLAIRRATDGGGSSPAPSEPAPIVDSDIVFRALPVYENDLESVLTISTSGTRGIRNNNPGNIRKSSDKWQGLASVQDDPSFFKFTEPKWGVRAMAKILENYQKKHGLNTVAGIISRWAPGHENPTDKYVEYVASSVGVPADAAIVVREHLPRLVSAIIRFENGKNPYLGDDISQWVYIA